MLSDRDWARKLMVSVSPAPSDLMVLVIFSQGRMLRSALVPCVPGGELQLTRPPGKLHPYSAWPAPDTGGPSYLARDDQRLHETLGSTPDNAIVLPAQSTKASNKSYCQSQVSRCKIHLRSNHIDKDCFVQHPEKKHQQTPNTAGSVAAPRATMFSISTPINTLSAVTSSFLWAVVDSGANEHCCNASQPHFNLQPTSPPVTIHGATGTYTCTLQGSLHLDLSLPDGGPEIPPSDKSELYNLISSR